MANEFKNVKITVDRSVTVNIGDFQNIRPGYVIEAELNDGVHPTDARNKLKALIDSWLEEDITEAGKTRIVST